MRMGWGGCLWLKGKPLVTWFPRTPIENKLHHLGLCGMLQEKAKFRKILVSVKFVCPQFWGRRWVRQFYGRLEKCVLSAGKTHVHKIPRFREGGVFWVFGGGGGVPILFLWARGFF